MGPIGYLTASSRNRKGSATYNDIGGPDGYLARTEPFNGNSLSAAWSRTDDGAIYVVTSYSTAIAEYNPRTGNRWLNEQKYSVTTSRHQSLVAAWLPNTEG